VFVNYGSSSPASQTVRVATDNATIVARNGGTPTIHVVDSESDFAAEFDVAPTPSSEIWQAVGTAAQAPVGSRRFFVLLAAVGGTVLFHQVAVRPVKSTGKANAADSFVDDFTKPGLPGWHTAPGVDWVKAGAVAGDALRLTSDGTTEVGTYTTKTWPVSATTSTYQVSAQILSSAGAPHFKIAVGWLDDHGRTIGYIPDWPQWPQGVGAAYAPLTVSLWHPRNNSAIALQFSAGLHQMLSILNRDSAGEVTTEDLGTYASGSLYHVVVQWRHGEAANLAVTFPDGHTMTYVATRGNRADVFEDPFINLSIQATASSNAETSVKVSHARLVIPAQTRFAINVADSRLELLIVAVVVWLVGYLLYQFGAVVFRRVPLLIGESLGGARKWHLMTALTAAVALLLLYAAAATVFDGAPFDRLSQEDATYVIGRYGLDSLYGRTSSIPDAIIRGGSVPWSPAEFAYPPGLAYFFAAANWLWEVVRGPVVPLQDRAFYVSWRLGFALFVLIGAALMLAIQRSVSPRSTRWGLVLVGAFALNPAVIFDSAIWGESNSVVSAAILLALFALVTGRYRLMWFAIVASLLIKQTALLAVPLIVAFAVGRRGALRTILDVPFGVVSGLALVAPLTLSGYHPITALMSTVQKLVDFGTPLTRYDTQVSADTFPIWVLFTGAAGLHGHDRLWASDLATVGVTHLTYANVGLGLFLVVAVAAVWAVWRAAKRDQPDPTRLMLAIGLVYVAYVSLNTRTSGHYLTLAIPFLLLAIPPRAVRGFIPVFAITLLAVVSGYGLYMYIAAKGEWPVFAGFGSPSTNAVSSFVYQVYTSDVAITLFAAWLAYVTFQLLLAATSPTREVPPKRKERVQQPEPT